MSYKDCIFKWHSYTKINMFPVLFSSYMRKSIMHKASKVATCLMSLENVECMSVYRGCFSTLQMISIDLFPGLCIDLGMMLMISTAMHSSIMPTDYM